MADKGSRAPAGPAAAMAPPRKGTRKAYFPEAAGFLDTPVYDRYALRPGAAFEGPAIIEERESTTVVGPAAHITVDAALTVIAEPVSA
jgi:N-methylhydantoinase A